MRAKEKNILIFLGLIIIALLGIYLMNKSEKKTYAFEEEKLKNMTDELLKISNVEEIDLDQIISQNSKISGYREEISVEEVELEYITKYRNNSDIYIGTTSIYQEGRNGLQAITTKRTYNENGEISSENQVSAVVIKASINKIIDIGTKKKEVKSQSKITNLDFNMALNRPSGFTIEQFKKILTDSKDKNKIFQKNAEYFYYAEKQYNINGLFVAAVGIHESAWGTSKIALNKHNLFGYGAYDSNPYNGAYTFDDYSEAIDLVSRVFVKYYLNPKGTKIYDNQTANGKYYSGNTLSSVNKKYASDKNWANGVYTHVKYLYEKIK